MKTTLGIIIPVYNGQRFIAECLDSVLQQSRTADEVIVVDDGSTDSTPEILRKYEHIHETVRIVRRDNAGQGAARNHALSLIGTDYVVFVDADDKLESRALSEIGSTVDARAADILHFKWSYFWNQDGKETRNVKDTDSILDVPLLEGSECDKLLTITNYFSMNNAFRTAFLREHGIAFGENMIYEDNAMMVKAINRAERIGNLNQPLYLYRKDNQASSSRSGYEGSRHFEDSTRAIHEAVDVFTPRSSHSASYLFNYYSQKMVVYYEMRIPSRYRKEFIRRFVDELSRLDVDEFDTATPKFTRVLHRYGLIKEKRYGLVRLLVVLKVLMSRGTRAQQH